MDNFSPSSLGYDKKEVNDFVDYVIKKTEENVTIIREQSNELNMLRSEVSKYKRLENSFYEVKRQADIANQQIRDNDQIYLGRSSVYTNYRINVGVNNFFQARNTLSQSRQ